MKIRKRYCGTHWMTIDSWLGRLAWFTAELRFAVHRRWALILLICLFGGVGCRSESTPAAQAGQPVVTANRVASSSPMTLVPTFTPTTPSTLKSATSKGVTQTMGSSMVTATSTPTPAPPTPTLLPVELLAQGQQYHRYGNYAAARTALTTLATAPVTDLQLKIQTLYALARTELAENHYTETLATLDRLQKLVADAKAAQSNEAIKAEFLRAEAFSGLGEYSQAIAAYWRLLESYPWMAEVAQQRIAANYLALGDGVSAAVAYRRAADVAPDAVARSRLLEALAQTYSGLGQYQDAVKVYDEILTLAEKPPYRAEIQVQAGQALASAGAVPAAIDRWRAATKEAPASGAAYRALVELVNREAPFDLVDRGLIDLYADALIPAINAFQAYLENAAPTDKRLPIALHGMGQAYLKAENYPAAIQTLDRILTTYPTCPCFGQAWLDKAAAQRGQGDTIAARRTFRIFAREHAQDPLAPEALWRSALHALYDGDQTEAATDFLTLADAFPQNQHAPVALYAVGIGAYQKGLYDQSRSLFTRIQEKYPTELWGAATYWLGRSHQARGQSNQARTEWQMITAKTPDSYYGVLAAQSLRQLPLTNGNWLNAMPVVAGPASTLANDDGSQEFAERWLITWLKTPITDLATVTPPLAEDVDLRMGRLLLEMDQRGDGLQVLMRVYQRNEENPRALYALSLEFERMGAYQLSLLAMQHLLELSPAQMVEQAPIFLQKHVYPRPFAELITQEALANNLNPLLYFSLIRQESLFEEGARSSAAAQGLAQIIPDTGHWVAERLGHPEYTNDLIYRPYINLQFGAYYLAWARDYLDNNLVSALVGYNAGPGNAEHWRTLAGADDTLFVELLNVYEPRIYVQSITTSLYHYTRLYG